jgi:hypothetical protein
MTLTLCHLRPLLLSQFRPILAQPHPHSRPSFHLDVTHYSFDQHVGAASSMHFLDLPAFAFRFHRLIEARGM